MLPVVIEQMYFFGAAINPVSTLINTLRIHWNNVPHGFKLHLITFS